MISLLWQNLDDGKGRSGRFPVRNNTPVAAGRGARGLLVPESTPKRGLCLKKPSTVQQKHVRARLPWKRRRAGGHARKSHGVYLGSKHGKSVHLNR